MSTKKAGWLIDYDGNQFIPMTSAFEIFNRHGARTFGYAEANDDNLGDHNKLIFIQNGVFMASTQTLAADGKTLMYLNNGSFVRSAANEGSSVNPVYLSGGTLVASNATIGSATKPVWLNAGTITVSNGNVATSKKTLMYMSGGELLASDETEGANDKFIYLNSGTLTASNLSRGGADTPVYFVNGVVTEGNSSLYSLGRSTESNNITIALGRGNSPAYSTISYNLGDNLIGDATTNTITAGYQDAKFSTGLQISEGSVSEDNLFVPYAGTSQYGVIKAVTGTANFDGNLSSTKSYKLSIDPEGIGYVYVPWENDYPSLATTSTAGIMKIAATRSSAITATTGSTTANRYYGVELDSDGQAFVNVPWTNTHYTAYLRAGTSTSTSNSTTNTSDPYLILVENSTRRSGVQLKGGANVSIGALNGVITISATSTDDKDVIQTEDDSDDDYPILTRWTIEDSGNSGYVGYNTSCTINHSTGTIMASAITVDELKANTSVTTPSVILNTLKGYGSDISINSSLIPSGNYCNLGTAANHWNSVTAVSFNAISDARLKENFVSFKPKKSILDLPVYKFDFINGAKNQIGCKAQDLQLICPELVVENDEGRLTIKENKIVYLLLDKMKEMQEEINELKGV